LADDLAVSFAPAFPFGPCGDAMHCTPGGAEQQFT
jgi:hypothetical protein